MLLLNRLRQGPVEGVQVGYSPTRFVRPLPVWFYYVDGLLIDTGSRHTQRAVLDVCRPLPIDRILLTHFHEDHAANAAALRRQHGAPVLAGPLTADRIASAFPLLPYERFWFGPIDPCPGALPLPPVVDTARYRLLPIATPGHSDDHHVFLEEREGWLFAGDFYIGNLKIFRRGEDIYRMIAATRHLLTYDFDVVFCGHNPVLRQGRQAVARKLDYLETLVERTLDAHRRGLSVGQIVRAVGLREGWLLKVFTGNDVGADYLIRSILAPSVNEK